MGVCSEKTREKFGDMSKIAKDSQPVSHHKHITFGGDIVSPMAEVKDADGKQGEAVVFGRQTMRDGKVLVVAAQKVKSAQKLRIKSLRFAGARVQVVFVPPPSNLFFKFCSSCFCADAFFIVFVCPLRLYGTEIVVSEFVAQLGFAENRLVRCFARKITLNERDVSRQDALQLHFPAFAAPDANAEVTALVTNKIAAFEPSEFRTANAHTTLKCDRVGILFV